MIEKVTCDLLFVVTVICYHWVRKEYAWSYWCKMDSNIEIDVKNRACYLFIYLLIYLFSYLFIFLFIDLFTYLFIYLFIFMKW